MSDHIAELNERPKLGGGEGGVNVALWVVTPTGYSLKEATRRSV